jgi:leader peptidase (prepilin peptidase)/N-methyltransferase
VGSFLNVVAHRLPLALSVVRPRSRCPGCLSPIRPLDNVPVLSWLLLRGRCRGCLGRIAPRYAAVEAFAGLLAVHVVAAIVLGPGRAHETAAWLHATVVFAVSASLLAASLVDWDHRILPDEITIPGMWAGPALCAFVPEIVLGPSLEAPSWLPGGWPPALHAAATSACGVAVGAGLVWTIGEAGSRVLGKEAMGFGDVKFLGMIGGFAGPAGALLALVVGSFAGAAAGIVRLALTGDRYIPFGPFLALGGHLAMLHGRAAIERYLASLS